MLFSTISDFVISDLVQTRDRQGVKGNIKFNQWFRLTLTLLGSKNSEGGGLVHSHSDQIRGFKACFSIFCKQQNDNILDEYFCITNFQRF